MRITDGNWELDHDLSIPGVRTVWKAWDGEKLHVRTDYPTENLVRENAIARAESDGKRMGDIVRQAQVPLNVYYDSGLAEANAQGDRKFISKWLNNPDHEKFRTTGAKV